jgi:hypothetical protein
MNNRQLVMMIIQMARMIKLILSNKKEVINQALHLSIGFTLTVILAKYVGMLGTAWFVFSLALLRELWQHRGKEVGIGSWRDSLFWFIGCFLGGLV